MNDLNYTDIDLSKDLIYIKLDPNTADMCWISNDNGKTYGEYPIPIPYKDYPEKENTIPCWSVGALEKLAPSIITDDGTEYCFELIKDIDGRDPFYIIGYFNIDNDKDELNQFEDNSLIDCLTDLFIWLIRGNYLDNSKQKLN